MHQVLFAMLKPDLVRRDLVDDVLQDIEFFFEDVEGFDINNITEMQLTKEQAEELYIEHKDKPFFKDMINFITADKIVVFFLEGENIIEQYREFIGATDPKKAAEGTLRNKYGISIDENSFHASDSEKSAEREIALFKKFLGIR